MLVLPNYLPDMHEMYLQRKISMVTRAMLSTGILLTFSRRSMRSIFSWIFSADAASERSVADGVGVANGSENDNVERALRPSMRIRS